MIVEDEPILKAGLSSGFHWQQLGFTVCGTAGDGREAVQLLEKMPLLPHVIMTDIEMPCMDGIALLKYIHEKRLAIKTVVLSGYDNFHYAQSALKYGACDYLLKPLKETAVIELFGRLHAQLEQEQEQNTVRQYIEKVVPSEPDKLLELSLSRCISEQNHDITSLNYLLDHYGYLSKNTLISFALLECSRKQYTAELERRLRGFLEEHYPSSSLCCSLRDGFAVLFFTKENGREAERALSSFLEDCEKQPEPPHMSVLRAVLYPSFSSMEEFPQLLATLLRYRSQSYYFSYGAVHRYDAKKAEDMQSSDSFNLADEIAGCIAADQPQALQIAVRHHFSQLTEAPPPRDLVVVKTTEAYCDAAAKLKSKVDSLVSLSFEQLYQHLVNCSSLQELHECFLPVVAELYQNYRSLAYGEPDTIDQVQAYINQNYQQKLTLSSLSEMFYFSPNYLSTLFCKKTGVTLSTYIKNVRMRRAKQILSDTRLSINEVARLVGYNDYRHFCSLFKKEFHQSPHHYRLTHSSQSEPVKESR